MVNYNPNPQGHKSWLVKFWKDIPKDLVGNLKYRERLVKELAEDRDKRKQFLLACIEYPPIFFDALSWTFNPRLEAGKRNLPFILRPAQVKAILAIKEAIDNGHDLLINKSRDEGATWIVTSMFFLYWLLVPDSIFLVASRKEDLVDKAGNRDCLFYRFIYLNNALPDWLKVHNAIKTHLHWENPNNGSTIAGESTNPNLGAGGRALAIMLDEFGRVDHSTAQAIRETVSDVSPCNIYNSTHFYGRGHPFAKLLYSRKVPVISLPWYDNPDKNSGLYKSPDLNKIKLLDNYYHEKYPFVFEEGKTEFIQSEVEKDLIVKYPAADITFKADGENLFRAPWYDHECDRRDDRDIAQNLDMNPVGAGDMFFDPETLQRIRQSDIREPDYTGEVEYDLIQYGGYREGSGLTNIKFVPKAGRNRLRWWGKLPKNRPIQEHNYVVACDISLGVGASNSVASIYDVNTYEKVGTFVSPDLPPESFADQVIAICHWIGGSSKRPYLVWEANGPGGSFDKRVKYHGYSFVYFHRQERSVSRNRGQKRGWYSNRESKYDLLLELRIALAAGINPNSVGRKLIVHEEASLTEYEDYLFYENGDIGLSTCMDDTSGARAAHGDRVIPDGMFVLCQSEQRKAAVKEKAKIYEGSMAHRRLMHSEHLNKDRGGSKWLL